MKYRLDPGQIEVVDDAVAEILRRKTTAERGALVAQCHETMRLILAGGVKTRHSDWSQQQIEAEVSRRLLHA